MKAWLASQMAPILASDVRLGIVIDPERLLSRADIESIGEVAEADGWYSLRRTYEQHGRRRGQEAPRLVIVVHSTTYQEPRDLPYDIERASTAVRLRVPVPPEYRRLVLDLPDDLSQRAVEVLGPPRYGDLGRLLARLWGVDLGTAADQARELDVAIRLRLDPTIPDALWPLLRPLLKSPLARALASMPVDAAPLQEAWDDYAVWGGKSQLADTITTLGPRLMPLFHLGLLQPVAGREVELPSWAAAGIAPLSADALAEGLLESRPDSELPGDLAGWVREAEWWAQVRAAVAQLTPGRAELRRQAWEIWTTFNTAFVRWLESAYGPLLLTTSAGPLSVDRIAAYLANRVKRGEAKRIALIVLDGMGLCQWAMIQRRVPVTVVQPLTCVAMIPTLTPISRQAIFRGALPMYFTKTINSTARDGDGWRDFWAGEGVPAREVGYQLITGASAEPVSFQAGMTAVGIVVQAIDKMLHGANLLGDAQLVGSVHAWADSGVLRDLVVKADNAGYEIWLTSDHGNLETTPLGRAMEGLAVETAGLRVRLYSSPALRDGSRVRDGGIAWDAPGLPTGWCYPLFAPGRDAYFSGEVRVTHGGLSLDEVIVPLVRVLP